MKAAGLAVAEQEAVATVYRPNVARPRAEVLTALLAAAPPAQGDSGEQRLRGQLATLGAPLAGRTPKGRHPPAEEVLADALVLAHRSPTVARVLPVAFWRQRNSLDFGRLQQGATRRDERQTLGFYLELTGRLGGDRRLERRARSLRAGSREIASARSALGLSHEHGARELRRGLPQARAGCGVRYYARAEIERFLRAVDEVLERRATIIVIGGGAAAVKYRADDPITDIDTFGALGADLKRAIDTARKATGLPMPFEHSEVADGPYHFEDRLAPGSAEADSPPGAGARASRPGADEDGAGRSGRLREAAGHPPAYALRPSRAAPALRGGDGSRRDRPAAAARELPGSRGSCSPRPRLSSRRPSSARISGGRSMPF